MIIAEGFVHRWKLIYCKWNTRPLLHSNFTFLHQTLINPATALEIITKLLLVWGYNTVQYNGWSPRINPQKRTVYKTRKENLHLMFGFKGEID